MSEKKKNKEREYTYSALKNIAGITVLPILLHKSGLIVSKTGKEIYIHPLKALSSAEFKEINLTESIKSCIMDNVYNFNMTEPWFRFLRYSLVIYLLFAVFPWITKAVEYILKLIVRGIKELIKRIIRKVRKKDIADKVKGLIYGLISRKPKSETYIGIEITAGVNTYFTGTKIDEAVTVLKNPIVYSPNNKSRAAIIRLIFINTKKHLYIAGKKISDGRRKRRRIQLKRKTVVYTGGMRITIRKFNEE